MRRLFLSVTFLFVSAWLLFSACERDDYRSVLPLRPLDGGSSGSTTDMPVDLARPPQPGDLYPPQDLSMPQDMPAKPDMGGAIDGGSMSYGSLSDGGLVG